MIKTVRDGLNFLLVFCLWSVIRLLPLCAIRWIARGGSYLMWVTIPSIRKISVANICAAMPETSVAEAKRIARESCYHMSRNMLEFVWMNGIPCRIERCCRMPDAVKQQLQDCLQQQKRIIFVNPHLGSWEASGLMAPYYANVEMVAIAKPIRNKYLNSFFNRRNREKVRGLQIVFSRGAVKAAIQALRQGRSLGTLIDQNTRVRDGGEFVNFFGLPVPCSKSPVLLGRFCIANALPVEILYGVSYRETDGTITCSVRKLKKDIGEYTDDLELLQELMLYTEENIRRIPEQYLWYYKRFQYIPHHISPELRKRYPYYAVEPGERFYSRTARKNGVAD